VRVLKYRKTAKTRLHARHALNAKREKLNVSKGDTVRVMRGEDKGKEGKVIRVLLKSGRVVIDVQAHTLTYVIQGQPPLGAPSGPLALNRKRHWVVEGNVLTLTTKGTDDKALSVAKWQKLP